MAVIRLLDAIRQKRLVKREVIMHGANGLHRSVVSNAEPMSVGRFESTEVRVAVVGKRDGMFFRQPARHASGPEPFIAQVLCGPLMNLA